MGPDFAPDSNLFVHFLSKQLDGHKLQAGPIRADGDFFVPHDKWLDSGLEETV